MNSPLLSADVVIWLPRTTVGMAFWIVTPVDPAALRCGLSDVPPGRSTRPVYTVWVQRLAPDGLRTRVLSRHISWARGIKLCFA